MDYAVEFKNITKKFPGVIANDDITIKIKKQEVHSILGENGSGKSTLMNILFGLYKPDDGEIYINSEKANISNPEDANRYGIGMVHQHFMLVDQMTVLENIILGKEADGLLLDNKKSKKRVKQIIDKYGFNLDLNKKISDLSIGMKQKVEIIKTLYKGVDTVILDEPSAVLIPQEVKELFTIIKNLKAKGKTIIFITHKLNEIMEVADRITVIRKGKVITTINKEDTNIRDLSYKMVGRDVRSIVTDSSENYGDVILKVNNLKLLENNNEHISFSIKSGEIFGIAGVDGNGQLQLEESIVGLRKNEKDSIVLNNIDLSSLSSSERKKLGIAYIPSDRHKRAILHSMTIKENALLGFQDSTDFVNSGFIDYQKLGTYADELIEKFDIRVPNNEVKINNLSGGNQQKVVLARETNCDPNLIIAAQPTRGLDVGAIEFIHKNLINLKSQGKAILLISAELSEVMNLSDRIGVLFEGKLQVILDRKDFDKEKIGFYMAGNKEVKDAKK